MKVKCSNCGKISATIIKRHIFEKMFVSKAGLLAESIVLSKVLLAGFDLLRRRNEPVEYCDQCGHYGKAKHLNDL